MLVGGHTLESWRLNGVDLRRYTSARISRIYTVLVPALLIGACLDHAGIHWLNESELYTDPSQYRTISLGAIIANALDLPTLLGNLAMMQGILTVSYGSNTPLWSLSYEWWYYTLFALISAASLSRDYASIAYAVIAVVVLLVLPGKIILWGLFWLLGLSAHVWISSRMWRPPPWLGVALLVTGIVASRLSHNISNLETQESLGFAFGRDMVVAIGYVAALVSASRLSATIPFPHLHKLLAAFSYTTYLCHFPAMVIVIAAGFQLLGLGFRVQPELYGVTYMLTTITVLYFYCFIVSHFSERYTSVVRTRLDALLKCGRTINPI
jgi:peptidoglycan/LPS O-acetylase OafA/YrhL